MSAAAKKIEEEIPVVPVATEAVEAPANDGVEDFGSKINEDLAKQMSALIVTVVNGSGLEDLKTHPAITGTSADHEPSEIVELLTHCGTEAEATEEGVAPYLATLDHAKKIALEELFPTKTEAPATTETGKKSKKGKGKKGGAKCATGKTSDAKPAKPAKAKEFVKVETVDVASSSHELPEKRGRAKDLAMPKTFHLESSDLAAGSLVHQVDPSRRQGFAPIMPDLDMLKKTGNPYAATPDDRAKTSARYAAANVVSHHTYAYFAENGEIRVRDKDVIATILDAAGAKEDSATRGCISDTMRDCALYGLATQYMSGRMRLFKKG